LLILHKNLATLDTQYPYTKEVIMSGSEIQRLIQYLSKLPGLGPRSGRRLALHLLKKREQIMLPLIEALQTAEATIKTCQICYNLDSSEPCYICMDARRDGGVLCVVQDVADLWALERANVFRGRYHVLGGVLSAIDGMGPDQLTIEPLVDRIQKTGVKEVVLALNATIDGQTTIHYLIDRLQPLTVSLSTLAHGVPIGGELDYLDDGTLTTAFTARRAV
jgi:recombination protein RecR